MARKGLPILSESLPSCWDEVLGAMPEATLALRRAAFRRLLLGRPVPIDDAAASAGLARETAREAADLVASVGMAEIDGAMIVGIDGLTTRPTRHRIVLNDVVLWTWCAYDIVGIAAALEADAVGRTQCGLCGREIVVVIRQGDPQGVVAIGWIPDEFCSNVLAEFCPSALLFCSRAHLDEWKTHSGVPSGEALDIESLAERGRNDWRQLVPTGRSGSEKGHP